MGSSKRRYDTLDITRALAIVLVVIGHYCEPYMPSWYITMHDVIYLFHMPLFMFISGYLYYVTRSQVRDGYCCFLKKKFKRLVIPYITTSIVILTVKLISEKFLPVDNPVTVCDFISMFYLPSAGYFLWFLWALWWCMMIIPFFKSHRSIVVLLCVSSILYFMYPYVTQFMCLSQFCATFIYFVLGAVAAIWFNDERGYVSDVCKYLSMALFCVLAVLLYPVYSQSTDTLLDRSIFLLLAITGIAMSLSLCYMLNKIMKGTGRRCIMSVSFASFFIYLFHTMFEGFAKGLLGKYNFYSDPYLSLKYIIGILFVTGCGVAIPYIIDRKVLSRSKILRSLFGI